MWFVSNAVHVCLIPLPLPFLNPFLRYFTRTHMSTIESVECGFVSEVFPFQPYSKFMAEDGQDVS